MKKRIYDFKFEVEFGYDCNLITLKVCEHYQLQHYVPDKDFYNGASFLLENSSPCPVCGKEI
jgi:hypothetical protein